MNKLNLKSLPRLKDSISYLYIERGVIERDDKSICVFDETGKTQIPVAIVTLLMLGPGTKISHAAIQTTAATGCLICWVGEESVRFYAAGMGETRSASFLIKQAQLVSNRESRIAVARAMYSMRFEGPVAPNLTIDQLRGKEGARVRDRRNAAFRSQGALLRRWRRCALDRHPRQATHSRYADGRRS